MQPTQALIDELFQEEVEEARRMTSEQKLLAGEVLSRCADRIKLVGIEHDNPDIDNQRALRIFLMRFDLIGKREGDRVGFTLYSRLCL